MNIYTFCGKMVAVRGSGGGGGGGGEGGVMAQTVERATPSEEILGSICGCLLPTGWVGVSIM